MAVSVREHRSLNTRQPFSRAEARAAGITLRELLGPRFHRILYDCYVASSVPITTTLRAQAALGVSPRGSFVSHHTAAVRWGAVAPDSSDVHVTVSPATSGVRSRRGGIASHRAIRGVATTMLHGLPITTPQQTFLDLADCVDFLQLVVLGDSLIAACGIQREDLIDASRGWHARGAKRARKAAGYVRAGVDSPAESRLRLLLVLAGLPEPIVNEIVRNADRSWRWRFDLSFPQLKLIIEYDGRQHAEDSRQWRSDLKRREQLDALGWRIIVVTKHDLYENPEHVLVRVRDALIDRGATGIRRTFKTDWVRFFARA